jgi:hypothetical protein
LISLRSKLVGGAAILASALSFSLLPASASAAGVVVFTSTANVSPGVPLVGGSGSYNFNSGASSVVGACAGVGVTTAPSAGGPLCTIIANGTYSSVACGTGITGGGPTVDSDTANITYSPIVGSAAVTLHYSIVFAAGVGVISTIAGGGVVDILPTAGNCVTAPVTAFQATGAAAAVVP